MMPQAEAPGEGAELAGDPEAGLWFSFVPGHYATFSLPVRPRPTLAGPNHQL